MQTCIHCFASIPIATIQCPHCGYDIAKHFSHPLHLAPLQLLNQQYQLGRVLGQGGFGITYIGFDTYLNHRVAIKEFLPASLASRNIGQNVVPLLGQAPAFAKGLYHFIAEARHLAKFDHPNIVRVRHYFESNQTAYMVMDYIEGQNLLFLLKKHNGHLPINVALSIILPILDALASMHNQQVYHLDISAHNILFKEVHKPILIDFGAARQGNINGEYSQTHTLMLKPGYSPLEQYYQGFEHIGAWTDIYACSALLYLLLTGKLPPPALERNNDDKRVQSLKLGVQAHEKRITQAILKGLTLNAQQRPANVGLFKALLLPASQDYSKNYWLYLSSTLFAGSIAWVYLPPMPSIDKPIPATISPPIIPVSAAPITVKKPKIATMADKAALNTIDKPNNTLQSSVNKLLKQAYIFHNNKQYESAYQRYQAVLQLDVSKIEVHTALQRLEQDYLIALKQQPQQISLLTLARQHFPDNHDLLQLEQQWQTQQKLDQAVLQQQRTIKKLLSQAQRQMQAQKLTTPANDNAHNSYLDILKIQANHTEALKGLQKIAQQYARWASKKTEFFEKNTLIDKGLNVIPNHPDLLHLQAAMDFDYVNQQNQKYKQQQTEQLADLLNKAMTAQTQQHWNLAERYYQQILLRQENHLAAKQGLIRIAQHYLQQATERYQQQKYSDSLFIINKGLAINLQNDQLLALQQKIQHQLSLINTTVPVKIVPIVAKKTAPLTPPKKLTVVNPATKKQNLLFTPTF